MDELLLFLSGIASLVVEAVIVGGDEAMVDASPLRALGPAIHIFRRTRGTSRPAAYAPFPVWYGVVGVLGGVWVQSLTADAIDALLEVVAGGADRSAR